MSNASFNFSHNSTITEAFLFHITIYILPPSIMPFLEPPYQLQIMATGNTTYLPDKNIVLKNLLCYKTSATGCVPRRTIDPFCRHPGVVESSNAGRFCSLEAAASVVFLFFGRLVQGHFYLLLRNKGFVISGRKGKLDKCFSK